MYLAGLVLLVPTMPLLAQDGAPKLFGKADFEMEWRLFPQNNTLRVLYEAARQRLRIEALDGSDQVMIRDLVTGKIAVLVAGGKRGAYGTMAKPLGAFRPEAIGEIRSVAGQQCREFAFEGRKMCVTDDGIPVEVDLGEGRLIAARVMRKAQHPALFDVPKDVTLKPIPGANPGGLPRVPF
ncbi:MAG TPA: hypothetical protein PKW21_02870 [Rhabdaerophilum sp.]|nr:hypothetical protein [Rhabdaerophilum sp.]